MAAITSSAVSLTRSFEVRGFNGALIEKVSDLTITLSAQGGTKGDIPASVLGFSKIFTAEAFRQNAGSDYASWVGIWSDGSGIFTANLGTGAPANYTGVIDVRITGMA